MTDYAGFYGIYDNPGERFFLMYLTQIQLYLIFPDDHDHQSGIFCPTAAYDEQIDCSTTHAVGAESEEDRAAVGLDPSFS